MTNLNKYALTLFQNVLKTDEQLPPELQQEKAQHLNRYLKNNLIIAHDVALSTLLSNYDLFERLSNPDKVNFGATFYATIEEANQKSELELLINQFIHYVTGYTQIHEATLTALSTMKLNQYVIIKSITEAEFDEKLNDLLASPVALSDETLTCLTELYAIRPFPTDNLGNRDLKRHMMKLGLIQPKNLDEAMTLLLSQLFDQTGPIIKQTVIKELSSRVTFSNTDYDKIKNCLANLPKNAHLDVYRWKKILLLIKHNLDKQNPYYKEIANHINRLTRKAKVKHRPFNPPLLTNLLNVPLDEKKLAKALEKASVYQLIKLFNYIREQLSIKDETYTQAYIIRNGTTFIKERPYNENKHALLYLTYITKALMDRYKDKNIVIKRPVSPITLAMPVSERKQIGQYPEFTSVNINSKKPIIGILWQGEPNEHLDFDLHAHTESGKHIGFNDSQDDFSGDMTRTNKHGYAAEYIVTQKRKLISVSAYSIPDSYNYDLFIADDEHKDPNTIISLSHILARLRLSLNDTNTQQIAVHTGDKLILSSSRYKGNVPQDNLAQLSIDILERKANVAMTLEQFSLLTGVPIVTSVDNLDEETTIIDLSDETLTFSSFTKLYNEGQVN